MKKIILFFLFLTTMVFAASWQKIATSSSVSSSIVDIFKDGSGIALYKLDGNANDAGGTYNGTPSNITYTTGKIGQASVLNGGSSSVVTTNLLKNSTAWSVSLWFKSTSTNGGGIFSFDNPGTLVAGNNVRAYISGQGYLRFGVGNLTDITSTCYVLSGQWHHLVLGENGNGFLMYVDGSLYNNQNISGTINNQNSFMLGKFSDGASFYYFNGSIDQVRIFNRALTQAEVTQLYNEGL